MKINETVVSKISENTNHIRGVCLSVEGYKSRGSDTACTRCSLSPSVLGYRTFLHYTFIRN